MGRCVFIKSFYVPCFLVLRMSMLKIMPTCTYLMSQDIFLNLGCKTFIWLHICIQKLITQSFPIPSSSPTSLHIPWILNSIIFFIRLHSSRNIINAVKIVFVLDDSYINTLGNLPLNFSFACGDIWQKELQTMVIVVFSSESGEPLS